MKNSIYNVAKQIAKKENGTIVNNKTCYSIYLKENNGWIGAIDKNLNKIQGIAKKYMILWDENNGWYLEDTHLI